MAKEKIASAFVEVSAPMGEFIKNLQAGGKSFTGFATKVFGLAEGIVVAIGAIGFAASAISAVRFTLLRKSFIEMASAAEEARNLTMVALGDSAAATQEWARRVGQATGLAADEFFFATGQLQLLTSGLGLSEESALNLARGFSRLAVDVASFRNLEVADVVDKFKSALTGISKPLQNIGINVKQNAIEQEALALGINKSVINMSEQEKILLRTSAILRATRRDMGDFIRTAGGLANINRAIASQSEKAGTNIGEFMRPAIRTLRIGMLLLAKAGKAVAGVFAAIPEPIREFLGGIVLLIGKILPLIILTKLLWWGATRLWAPMMAAAVAARAWAASNLILGSSLAFVTATWLRFVVALGIAGVAFVLIGVLAQWLFKVFSGGKDILDELEKEFGDIKKQLDDVANAARGVNGQFRVLGSLAKAGFFAKLAVQTAAAPAGPTGPRIRSGSIDAAAFRPILPGGAGATATAPSEGGTGTLKDIHHTLIGIRRDNRSMKGLG